MALDLNRVDLEMIVKIVSNSHGLLTGKEFNKINCIYVTMSCMCVYDGKLNKPVRIPRLEQCMIHINLLYLAQNTDVV